MVALGKDGCKFNFSMLRSAHMCKPYRIGTVRITIGTADKKEHNLSLLPDVESMSMFSPGFLTSHVSRQPDQHAGGYH
jgi:hypothetical protein